MIFDGSWLKIDRAKKHINDFNDAVADFASSEPWVFTIEPDVNPKNCRIVGHVRWPFPIDLPLIAGDAIHNLRAALDILACDIVRATGITKPEELEETYFPFCKGKDPNDLKSRFAQTKVDRASKNIMDVFNSLNLRPGGDLYAIHTLDIEDKHRDLLAVASAGALPNLEGESYAFLDNMIINMPDGYKVAVLPLPVNAKLGDEIASAIQVLFGGGLPFQFRPVVPTLKRLTELVERTVDQFEKAT